MRFTEWGIIAARLDTASVRRHRRMLNELGFDADVIERQLAHQERNKVRAAYHRAEYLPERGEMMQRWADYIDELAEERRT